MRQRIDEARPAGDSWAASLWWWPQGVPVGLGSHVQWDRRLDARLAAAVMSIPAIKGVEIGPAFENARRPGTQVHDEILLPRRCAGTATAPHATAPAGSRAASPTASRSGARGDEADPHDAHAAAHGGPGHRRRPRPREYQRSDVCAVPGGQVVGEAMVAWVLADALVEQARRRLAGRDRSGG